jgi:hypothetical protein
MDPTSELYRLFPRLFHTDLHFLKKLVHSPTRRWRKLVFWAKASLLAFLHVYATLIISLVDVSDFVKQAVESMKEHPGLFGTSFDLFSTSIPHLPLPFRFLYSLCPEVHRRKGQTQWPWHTRLTRPPDSQRGL